MAVRIVWTDEAKKALSPRSPADVRMKRRKKESLWPRVLEIAGDNRLVRNLPSGIRERLPVVVPSEPDIDALAALTRAAELGSTANDIFDAVATLFGEPKLVELAVALHDQMKYPAHAEVMRRLMLLATPEHRAAALILAEAAFAGAGPASRAVLAYTFFERPEWSVEAAKATGAADALLLLPQISDPILARQVFKSRTSSSSHVDMVAALGEAALPLLLENFKERTSPAQHLADLEYTAEALAMFESDEVGQALVTELGKKQVRGAASTFFVRFPAIAKRVLPDVAKGKTKLAKLAADLLAQAERAAGTEGAPGEVAGGAQEGALHVPANAKAVSKVSAARAPRRTERVVIENVVLPPRPATLWWADPEAPARFRLQVEERKARGVAGTLGGDRLELFRAKAMKEATYSFEWTERVDDALFSIPDDLALALWNHNATSHTYRATGGTTFLALFGLDALPGFLRVTRNRNFESAGAGLLAVDAPPVAALVLSGLNDQDEAAWSYALSHVDGMIHAALPVAVGPLGKERDVAELYLREVARRGHRKRMVALATEAGAAVVAALEEVLSVDVALTDFSTKPVKMPETFRAAAFCRPRFVSGAELSIDEVTELAALCALSFPWRIHPKLAALKSACDARSLGEFGWDMANGWFNSGRSKRERWMLTALVHLADDEVTRRATPAIRDKNVLPVLGWIGTDAAATELLTVLARGLGKASAIYPTDMAEAAFESIARTRGVTIEALADAVVGTLGLHGRGEIEIDVGTRSVRAGLDHAFELFVVGEDGKRTKKLSVRKGDDGAKVAVAKAKLAELAEDGMAILAMRVESLRSAMKYRRGWTRDEFVRFWSDHPLQRLLGEGVVW